MKTRFYSERVSDCENSWAGWLDESRTEQSIISVTIHDEHTVGIMGRSRQRPVCQGRRDHSQQVRLSRWTNESQRGNLDLVR